MSEKIKITLTVEEHATVLAALRYYQSKSLGIQENRPMAIDDIATSGGDFEGLDDFDVDELCERINTEYEVA